MRNVTIALVKAKSLIEKDVNFSGATSRLLAYVSLETSDGIVVSGISVRQNVQNRGDIKVCYPGRSMYTETKPYVSFTSAMVEKETAVMILTRVREAMQNEINNDRK